MHVILAYLLELSDFDRQTLTEGRILNFTITRVQLVKGLLTSIY